MIATPLRRSRCRSAAAEKHRCKEGVRLRVRVVEDLDADPVPVDTAVRVVARLLVRARQEYCDSEPNVAAIPRPSALTSFRSPRTPRDGESA